MVNNNRLRCPWVRLSATVKSDFSAVCLHTPIRVPHLQVAAVERNTNITRQRHDTAAAAEGLPALLGRAGAVVINGGVFLFVREHAASRCHQLRRQGFLQGHDDPSSCSSAAGVITSPKHSYDIAHQVLRIWEPSRFAGRLPPCSMF